jgi:hypothetical protein
MKKPRRQFSIVAKELSFLVICRINIIYLFRSLYTEEERKISSFSLFKIQLSHVCVDGREAHFSGRKLEGFQKKKLTLVRYENMRK